MNKKLLPLAILGFSEDHSVEGITRFQKLVFLAQKEELEDTPYEFVAGSYGPYSKPLYDDIDRLVRKGFIRENKERTSPYSENNKQVYELTDKGENALAQSLIDEDIGIPQEALNEIVKEYNKKQLWDLLEYVYSEYPRMADNSNLDIA